MTGTDPLTSETYYDYTNTKQFYLYVVPGLPKSKEAILTK